MKIYDAIYEEASAFYLGRAFAQGEGALIVEPTLHPAKEYIESLRPCEDTAAKGRLSSRMREALQSLNAIKDGRIHPQGAEHILIREVAQAGASILFLTRVISAEKQDDLWHVKVLCLDKEKTLLCRHFYPKAKNYLTYCHALVRVPDVAAITDEKIQLYPTIYQDMYILRYPSCSLKEMRDCVSHMSGLTVVRFPSVACEMNDNDCELFTALDDGETGVPAREATDDVSRISADIRRYDCDVLVAGTGTAGVIAAIAAAQSGAKVVAADRLPFAGGLLTTTVFGYYYSAHGGLCETMDAYAKDIAKTGIAAEAGGANQLNPVAHIIAYDRMFEQLGIEFVGDALLYSVNRQGRRIQSVRFLTSDGIVEVACRFIIDGTSENHVCTMAGCGFHMGREFDHKTQPFSYVTSLCDPNIGLPRMHTSDFGYTDAADAEAVSDNIMRSAGKLALPENRMHLGVSSSLGAREGRCINGVSHLRWEDYFYERPTDRPVTFGLSNMDDHGKDMAFESRMHADWMVGMSMWGALVRLTVPMGALIPAELDNCTVAGRNLDMDHDCASHLRMMRDLRRIGEASGRLAALAVQHGCAANDVPYDELKQQLLASGCLSELTAPDVWDSKPDGSAVAYPTTDEEAHALMDSSKPGLAMLYLLRKGNAELYAKELSSASENLRFNSACLLALVGRDDGKKILLKMLQQRDNTLFTTSRKFNMTRGITALYLLGRLAVPESEAEMRAVMNEDTALIKYAVPSDEFFYRDEDTRFAYLSHAVRGLLEIAKVHPSRKESILAFLREKTQRGDFHTWYSLKTSKNVVKDGAEELRQFIDYYSSETP